MNHFLYSQYQKPKAFLVRVSKQQFLVFKHWKLWAKKKKVFGKGVFTEVFDLRCSFLGA